MKWLPGGGNKGDSQDFLFRWGQRKNTPGNTVGDIIVLMGTPLEITDLKDVRCDGE